MHSHPPRVGPGRRRYPAAVADAPATGDNDEDATGDDDPTTGDNDPTTVADHEDATGDDDPTTVADHEAAPVASDLATDEAATGGRSRGRSSAA